MQAVSSIRVQFTHSIMVGILNHFLHVADHGLLIVLIEKKLKKINLRVSFLLLKIGFFWVFENEKNLGLNSSMKGLILTTWVPGADAKIPFLSKQSLDSLY